ncbi:MAG: hypothetical protein RRY40_05405 [Oscillospiraceae bacterium]
MLCDYSVIIGFLREYDVFLMEFAAFNQKKLEDILTDKLIKIEAALKSGQEMEMRFKSYESKRFEMLKNYGLSDKSFREIIEAAPPDEGAELQKLFVDISRHIEDAVFYNKKAMAVLGDKMDSLRKKQEGLKQKGPAAHALSKKI